MEPQPGLPPRRTPHCAHLAVIQFSFRYLLSRSNPLPSDNRDSSNTSNFASAVTREATGIPVAGFPPLSHAASGSSASQRRRDRAGRIFAASPRPYRRGHDKIQFFSTMPSTCYFKHDRHLRHVPTGARLSFSNNRISGPDDSLLRRALVICTRFVSFTVCADFSSRLCARFLPFPSATQQTRLARRVTAAAHLPPHPPHFAGESECRSPAHGPSMSVCSRRFRRVCRGPCPRSTSLSDIAVRLPADCVTSRLTASRCASLFQRAVSTRSAADTLALPPALTCSEHTTAI